MSRLILPSTHKFMHKLQKFAHFLVLDFEATCERNTKLSPMEIIEFPVVKVNAQTLLSESEFHHYVRPVVHPDLTDFCTELTGIIQDMVEYQPCLEDVLKTMLGTLRTLSLILIRRGAVPTITCSLPQPSSA
ncbi:hypothetical protein AHF37_07533 [Paragonimus kellicotti]|nr:hypothetical protein AHF37_07533 [Paragonimus kellicotti]